MEFIKKTARKTSTIFSMRDDRAAFFWLRRGVLTLLFCIDGDEGMVIVGVDLISASADEVGAPTDDDDDSISYEIL